MRLFWLFPVLLLFLLPGSLSLQSDLITIACSRRPTLPYCLGKAAEPRQRIAAAKTQQEGAVVHSRPPGFVLSPADRQVCKDLAVEFHRLCGAEHDIQDQPAETNEFCEAYENVCFKIANEEQPVDDNEAKKPEPIKSQNETITAIVSNSPSPTEDFSEFCREFKRRYLYVCPDPFRFGAKAIVFCPQYAERCNEALPGRPVLPNDQEGKINIRAALCRKYRTFASNYCNNPLFASQPRIQGACVKFYRFCEKKKRRRRHRHHHRTLHSNLMRDIRRKR